MDTTEHQLNLRPLCPEVTHRPLIMAGPCSAESRAQVLQTAKGLQRIGIRYFRAGVWKPRTFPGGFEGMGPQALPWLQEVQEELGMTALVEVASSEHVQEALKHGIRFFWIGARTTSSPFAIEEIAKALRGYEVAVLVKNPIAPDPNLWIGALSRLNKNGIERLGIIHRGFGMGYNTIYRNEPIWKIAMYISQYYPNLPILCDPSHIAGRRDLIAELSQEAMDRCYSGLFIESHITPDSALSDAAQQVTPDRLGEIIQHLHIGNCMPCWSEDLNKLRHQIDDIDDELLRLIGERCRISKEIGAWKFHHDKTALQTERYETMIKDRLQRGDKYGVPTRLVNELYEVIHDASLKIQSECIESLE